MKRNSNIKNSNKDHAIVFSGDEEERVYCGKCDYMLIPWGADQLLCPNCEHLYSKKETLLHHQGFGPMEDKKEGTGIAEVIPLTNYYNKSKPSNKTTIPDKEDAAFLDSGSGRYYTSIQTYWPAPEEDD
jgi:hypothetical protein